jgi:hypothetical protein
MSDKLDLATEFFLNHTGQIGGCPRIDWYDARNALAELLEAVSQGQKPGEGAAQGTPADEQSGETSPASPAPPKGQAEAVRDVLAERQRQIDVEGYTPEHDDAVNGGFMLSRAAVSYIEGNKIQTGKRPVTWVWPWSDEVWKPSDRRRNLVKAGALILAEIERMDRSAPLKGQQK